MYMLELEQGGQPEEQERRFEAFSPVEIGVFAVSVPADLYAGSEIYEDLTHYPANIEVPAGQPNPYWRPSGLETAGMGLILPLLGAAALTAAVSGVRRVVHNIRH